MSGRRGGLRFGREGYMGGDGGGYEYQDYGYEYFTNSYGSPQGNMGTGRDGYYDRTERNRYSYSEPDAGYGRRRELCPPPPAQTGWGDPRGGFRGSFGSPPPVRGAGHPTPLFDQGGFQEKDGFQDLRAFTGNSYFGGGIKQRTKSWKKKMSRDKGQPAVKKMKTAENNKAKSEEAGPEGDGNAEEPAQSGRIDGDGEDAQEGTENKQPTPRRYHENPGRNVGDRMIERIQFVCSLCKFRTFYDEEMNRHLESNFHKEHFRYLGARLQKQEADFLQDYVMHKTKKTEERRTVIKDIGTIIHQIYRSQDLTQDLGMDQFVKKVEAAHCAACDVFIPMNPSALQQHLKSSIHKQKCRIMMETSKKNAVAVARGILNNKQISQKLELYKKGENPFTGEHEVNTRSGGSTETLPHAQEVAQVPCSSLSDSEQGISTEQCIKVEGEQEDTPGGQDNGPEDAEDSSCVLEGVEDAEVDAPDQQEEKTEMEESFTEDALE